MILLGALLAMWGGLVLGVARMLHVRWKGMLADMRRAGVRNDLPGTEFFASAKGLVWMRVVGGIVLAAGLAMIVVGVAAR